MVDQPLISLQVNKELKRETLTSENFKLKICI